MKFIWLAVFLAALGCDKPSSDGTKDRARQEQEAAREVESKTNAEKAQQMETQLALHHRFYASIEGRYAGIFRINGRTYEVLFTFARTIPEFDGSRVRQLNEIEADLTNLRLRAKAVQWLAADPVTGVTCLNQDVKITDFAAGALQVEMTCPAGTNGYSFFFGAAGAPAPQTAEEKTEARAQAQRIAAAVNARQLARVEGLVGEIAFANNAANARVFSAQRKQD